ncbi:MAG: hypothetical protein ACYC6L_12675 [Anaerolineae bacterium]
MTPRKNIRLIYEKPLSPFFRWWWGADVWLGNATASIRDLRNAFYLLVGSPDVDPVNTNLAKLALELTAKKNEGKLIGLGQIQGLIKKLAGEGKLIYPQDCSESDRNLLNNGSFLRDLTFYFDMIGWLGSRWS